MKVRINNNSVRIRLTKSEVARLADGASVEQATHFSTTTKFECAIEPCSDATDLQLTFSGSRLIIKIPSNHVARWAGSNDVGIESAQSIDASRSVQILVEKDFECLHPRRGEDEDAFPNPRA